MVKEIYLREEYNCNKEDYIGRFPNQGDYEEVVESDCDVYVGGEKVLSFRKAFFPILREGSEKSPEAWKFLREASREVYGTQRGIVAGSVFTSRPDTRLTVGQVSFFSRASNGQIETLEEARETLNSCHELTTKTIKIKWVKRAFPDIANRCSKLEAKLRDKSLLREEELEIRRQRREALWSWFEPWLLNEWLPSDNKPEVTRRVVREFISSQQNFNHCYSNVLGAIDRGSRFPYGRLSRTTQGHFQEFKKFAEIYASANEGFRTLFPERWNRVNEIISKVRDPLYSLFGTVFTSITLNFNFRTAFHLDKNNLKGGLAALTVLSRGKYKGHYLVFPQLRLAFDVKDGDLIIADTQALLHGNTEMERETKDAERISLVFYSREGMTKLEDLECESCRRDFLKYSQTHLPERAKSHKDWTGVWPDMWYSREWNEFKKERGLERCSNTNWRMSAPYLNSVTNEIKLFEKSPGDEWFLQEVCENLSSPSEFRL